jgi:hypothetical protein
MRPQRLARWLSVAGASVASLGLAALWLGSKRFDRLVQRDVAALFAPSGGRRDGIVTEDMLDHLPPPVRRHLTYTGVVGKPLVHRVHLTQEGAMRTSGQQPWLPLHAEQYYSVQPPGFVWDGTMHLGPLPIARARDLYLEGRGNMLIAVGSLVTVVDARGAELDQGALMRYLSEMIWFPSAFLGDNVSFEAVDDASARVTLTDQGRTVTGTLFVDAEGRLTKFVAERYRMVGSAYELDTWSASVIDYRKLAGLNIPVRVKVAWKLPEADLEYVDLAITELEYNVVSMVPEATTRNSPVGGTT